MPLKVSADQLMTSHDVQVDHAPSAEDQVIIRSEKRLQCVAQFEDELIQLEAAARVAHLLITRHDVCEFFARQVDQKVESVRLAENDFRLAEKHPRPTEQNRRLTSQNCRFADEIVSQTNGSRC